MGFFDKPEVTMLKDDSDAKVYLEKLEALQKEVSPDTRIADLLEKEIAITKAGIAGEETILFELKNSGMDLVVLHDIYVETEDGLGAQIDYIVITPYANVFIECKNLFGDITIDNNGSFIRSYSYGRKKVRESIYSPIAQNERHLTIFREDRASSKNAFFAAIYRKNFSEYNKSYVVLANPKTILNDRYAPKEIKKQVIRADQLVSVLKSIKTDLKSKKSEMLKLGNAFLAMNKEDRNEYISKFEKLMEESKAEPNAEKTDDRSKEKRVCPFCGRDLVLRTAKKGASAGKQFYGCSGFPMCRYSESI